MAIRKDEGREEKRPTNVVGLSAAAFTLLAVIIVLNEIVDLPHVWFDSPPTQTNWAEIGIELFFVLAIGLGTIFRLHVLDSSCKRSQEMCREERDKAQKYLDIAGVMVVAINTERKVTLVNKKGCEVLGYDEKDIIGKDWFENFVPQGVRGEVKTVFTKLIAGEIEPVEYFENPVLTKRGQERIIAWYNTSLKAQEGKVTGLLSSGEEITERKQAEEALRGSEERWKNIYEQSPIGIELYDSEGRLLDANKACLEIFGVSDVAVVKGFKLFEDPNVTDELKDRLRKGEMVRYVVAFDFGKVIEHELYATSKSGIIHIDVLITPLGLRREKRLGGYLVQVQDITERKQAEEALHRSEQNFRNSLDNSPLGIRIVTAEGELLYANQAILDIYGYSSIDELKAVPAKQRYTPESYAEYQERKEMRKLGKAVPSNYEISIVRKDGEVRHLSVLRKEVFWDGKTQFQTLYQDITERKQAESELRLSEEFNSSLLTNSPNPIVVLNADASIRYVNPALEKLTGFSSAELTDRKPPAPWWTEENSTECIMHLEKAMKGRLKRCEHCFRRKNGERFWVEMTFSLVKVAGVFNYYVESWVDVTEQKRLRENMQFYISEITKAQEEERKRISREIHDESVQSLAAQALDIDALLKNKERLPQDVSQRLQRLRVETNSIVDGLRRFSHELRPGVIDQVGLVPALEILTEELDKEGRINTRLEIVGSEQRLKSEVELELFRIAQEAVRNVRRHSRATQALIRLEFTRRKARLAVSDNGRGFKVPERLGDFAAEGKLGLIGMQERARLLGSKLLLKSRVSGGTVVIVEVET